MVFSKYESLRTEGWFGIAAELRQRLGAVERGQKLGAAGRSDLNPTKVLVRFGSDAGYCEDRAGDGDNDPALVGATHALTIFYDQIQVEPRTASLEYGSIGEAIDGAYVLRASLDRFMERHKLRVAGCCQVTLVVCKPSARFEVSFHGTAELVGLSEERFGSLLRMQLPLGTGPIWISRLSTLAAA